MHAHTHTHARKGFNNLPTPALAGRRLKCNCSNIGLIPPSSIKKFNTKKYLKHCHGSNIMFAIYVYTLLVCCIDTVNYKLIEKKTRNCNCYKIKMTQPLFSFIATVIALHNFLNQHLPQSSHLKATRASH